jgi:5-methylcytosine-specific restriction endonuclease McrA
MRRDYDDPIYAEWRKRVFSRDKHKCQMPKCGYKRALNAHHIVRWSDAAYLRFDINNGITLCWKCHKEITGAESQYAPLFMDIVRENNGRNSGSDSHEK